MVAPATPKLLSCKLTGLDGVFEAMQTVPLIERCCFCRESSVQVEALVGEVSEQMLKEISATEIKLEQERLAEEKRRLEEARSVP